MNIVPTSLHNVKKKRLIIVTLRHEKYFLFSVKDSSAATVAKYIVVIIFVSYVNCKEKFPILSHALVPLIVAPKNSKTI